MFDKKDDKFSKCKKVLYNMSTDRDIDIKTCIDCRKKFKCEYNNCKKVYALKHNLEKHIDLVHKTIKCKYELCDYKCSDKISLSQHVICNHKKIDINLLIE